MHYMTLVAVDIERTNEEPETDRCIERKIASLEKTGSMTLLQKSQLSTLKARRRAFERAVDNAVELAMEPYCMNTENPEYLEFCDMTDEIEHDYQTGKRKMIRLSNGSILFPYDNAFCDQYTIRDGKVFQRKAGPCQHEKRTRKAKKMSVITLPFRKIYSSMKEYAENSGYTFHRRQRAFGYYSNPDGFWDWYSIGGRWAYKLLVKADCPEYALGENDIGSQPPPVPEGYMWVSAARKKDIEWRRMQEWKKQKALDSFAVLEEAFAKKKMPEGDIGVITEEGISCFGKTLYIKGETAEEFLKRNGLDSIEKYGFYPHAFLDDCGWNTCEKLVCTDSDAWFENNLSWKQELNLFMEDTDEEAVFVIVDSHS